MILLAILKEVIAKETNRSTGLDFLIEAPESTEFQVHRNLIAEFFAFQQILWKGSKLQPWILFF